MKCPICNVDLLMTDRQGIEIDYCPQCRGIWLDRGELDKIIEKSQQGQPAAASAAAPQTRNVQEPRREEYYDKHDDKHYSDSDYKKKKKGGMLGELFDF